MFEKEAEEYGIASREICADVDDSDLIAEAYKDGAEFGYNKANEGENYELRIKITELQELLTDCLFYCYHVDPYYISCLKEDEIFERAEKLGVKYNV